VNNGRQREKEKEKELEIVKLFADFGLQLHPDAINLLTDYDGYSSGYGDGSGNGRCGRHLEIAALAEGMSKSLHPSICVISQEQIADFIRKESASAHADTDAYALTLIKSNSFPVQDIVADHQNFLPYFIDRYEKLSRIIKKHLDFNYVQIRSVRNGSREDKNDFSVIGMVSSINKTVKGNRRVELEDPTGSLSVIMIHEEELILDEIIGVNGFLADGGEYLIVKKIIYPDLPLPVSVPNTPGNLQLSLSTSSRSISISRSGREMEREKKKQVYAVFISDLHVGSNTFLNDAWDSFTDWLKEEARLSNRSNSNIAYLVVAGDIVDGIGVYPGQDKDLSITDIWEQYRVAARYFHDLPSHLQIVIAPGNHDAVRSAEPQPPLPAKIIELFPDNTSFLSNPARIEIGDREVQVEVLIYHGQSYDDFVNSISRLNYKKPEDVMIEMLRRRHLSPVYGKAVSIVPNLHDYGVIEHIPEIFHCGHTHTVGLAKYRNVLVINSGTWQSQTEYQKKLDITPVPGCATLVELHEREVKVMDFGDRGREA